ncbi:hypothetical protein C0J52_04282 [Blattella germanica]|nr:hypothetical protein C0J52_04282 [Blattella germanica]
MSLDSMRGTYGRCPPFLVAGLLVVCIILTFNWWSLSSQNYDLIRQIEELGEQLKISSEEQELCVQQRLSTEQRLKAMEEEMAQLRIQEEREREELAKSRTSLLTQEEDAKKTKKLYDEIKKSANMCNTELESLNKLGISKDSVIASLRLENKKYQTELEERNQELKQVQNDLSQGRGSSANQKREHQSYWPEWNGSSLGRAHPSSGPSRCCPTPSTVQRRQTLTLPDRKTIMTFTCIISFYVRLICVSDCCMSRHTPICNVYNDNWCSYIRSSVSPQKSAVGDEGIAIDGNHGQEAENEENNAGERGDDVNIEEGGGDNVLDDPAQHFDENRP